MKLRQRSQQFRTYLVSRKQSQLGCSDRRHLKPWALLLITIGEDYA
ncbi:MAG: hypothetical protein WBA10_09115 [Elainellaceae cyanobacterium]